jgi:hypothetical protein
MKHQVACYSPGGMPRVLQKFLPVHLMVKPAKLATTTEQ